MPKPAPKPHVVIDTNVFVAAVYWRGPGYQVFVAYAHRKFRLVLSVPILMEYSRQAIVMGRKLNRLGSEDTWLNWFRETGLFVEPVPLAKKLCRDPDDDKFLAAALSGSAHFIVTRDKDLLALGKPYGIEIIDVPSFLRRLKP